MFVHGGGRGGVKAFHRAILLVRDPYDAIWSEYQRRVTGSHVAQIQRNEHVWTRWFSHAASLSEK